MARFRVVNKKTVGALAVALVLASAAWLGRVPLLTWYCVGKLEGADEAVREVWVERVARLGDAAVPALLACLGRDDERACGNAGAALARLAEGWGTDDPRGPDLAGRLAAAFPDLSTPGKRAALGAFAAVLRPADDGAPLPADLAPPVARLVQEAATHPDRRVRVGALGLAAALRGRDLPAEVADAVRDLARAGLRDADPEARTRAVQLALLPQFRLLEQVVPLLHDPSAEVRRAAMLAVGPARDDADGKHELVHADDLLPWLHDPDTEVRRLCEDALLSRGLKGGHIKLGRLLTDPRTLTRMQVLDHLPRAADLDAGTWLRQMTHDTSPAVRIAAVRAAVAEYPQVNLSDRVDQMVENDPSPTVRDLARFYQRQGADAPRP